MPLVDSLRYVTPLGREVFGGGGIAPDVFVPWDSTATSTWVSEWIWTGILRDAVFAWMDANREALEACTNPSDIEALPGWKDGVVEAVFAQAEMEGWPWREPSDELASRVIESVAVGEGGNSPERVELRVGVHLFESA